MDSSPTTDLDRPTADPEMAPARVTDLEATDRDSVGLILIAALAAFWPSLASFPPTWNTSYQEHGFFVGGLVLWLLWRDRHRIVRSAGQGIPDLVPVIGLLSVVWLFAVVMNVRLIHQLLFWLIATLGALAIFGWRARRPILVIAATALLAIPFWSITVPILQRMTVITSGAATSLAGIEAVVGYDYISITTGTFLIEEGCAGINYLMGGLVLGAFYAHLFTNRWQTQLKIVAVAAAMSIVGNWIRVTVLIFLGEATAMQSPYIEDHLWQGWAIFTLLMIPTYFFARRIEQRDAERFSSEIAEEDGAADADVASSTAEAWPLRPRAVRTALVAAAGPILLIILGAIPRGGTLDRDAGIFPLAQGWAIEELPAGAESWVPDFKGIDAQQLWRIDGGGESVLAARYYFMDQRQGEELIQYNNRIAADSLVVADRIIGPIGPEGRFVHEAVVRDAETPRVVWYWYRVAGFDTPFDIKAKLLEVLAFFTRAPAAELVVLMAECAPDDCRDAAMTLRSATGVPVAEESAEP